MNHVRIRVYYSGGGAAELVVDANEDGSPYLEVTSSGIVRFKRTEGDDELPTWLMDIPVSSIHKIGR